MKLFPVLIALAATFIAVSSSTPDEKWKSYKTKFRKQYNGKEDTMRKALFLLADAEIQKNNNDPTSSFKMGHNSFSDWTEEEKKKRNGFRPLKTTSRLAEPVEVLNRQSIPSSYDLRSALPGCVTNIKNQGSCGDCWAFSTIASLECANFITNKVSISLSEQQLLDCDNTNYGCGGGNFMLAFQFLENTEGSESYNTYPYTSGNTGTGGTCQYNSSAVVTSVASARQYYGPIGADNKMQVSVSTIQNALLQYGTLSTSMYANTPQFNYYKSGILNIPDCTEPADHAINFVGWGTSNGTNYWIVRNSWGIGWGESGYFQIISGVNMCWIENYVASVVAK